MPRRRWATHNVAKRRTLKKRVRKQLQGWRKELKRDCGAHDRWSFDAHLILQGEQVSPRCE